MTNIGEFQFPKCHDEVLSALNSIGNERFAAWTPIDRRSELAYSGVKVPNRRALSKQGFSFSDRPKDELIAIWDDLFMHSPNGDVLFCALDFFRFRVQKRVESDLWSLLRHWQIRVENWAHADELSWIYSYVLEARFDDVHPDLLRWNSSDAMWPKRISIVSLIHYTGKKSVFLTPDIVLPMVQSCVADHRYYMQKATGWVLREMHRVYPDEVEAFLTDNLASIGADALTRAVSKTDKGRRQWWREQRLIAQAK